MIFTLLTWSMLKDMHTVRVRLWLWYYPVDICVQSNISINEFSALHRVNAHTQDDAHKQRPTQEPQRKPGHEPTEPAAIPMRDPAGTAAVHSQAHGQQGKAGGNRDHDPRPSYTNLPVSRPSGILRLNHIGLSLQSLSGVPCMRMLWLLRNKKRWGPCWRRSLAKGGPSMRT